MNTASSRNLDRDGKSAITAMAKRTRSDPESDPVTGAGLGAAPGMLPKTPMAKGAKAAGKRSK